MIQFEQQEESVEMNDTVKTIDVERDPKILAIGRRPNGEKGLLCWTGSSLVIRAKLNEWYADIEADWTMQTPYIGVMIDGAPVVRFALTKGCHRYTLLTGMDETEEHELALTRETQPMGGEPRLSVRVLGMEISGELLMPVDKPVIEVIGDSLTSGEGAVGPKCGMAWRSVWFSGMNTWAQALCRELNARGEWVSQSGWGLYTSWDNRPEGALPGIYECAAVHSVFDGIRHDFAGHPVQAVVINLGTNDWNALSALPESEHPERLGRIEEAAAAFLKQIHRCRPGTPVLFSYGMCGNGLSACLQAAVRKDAETANSPVMYLELPDCADTALGSRGHPGAEHQRLCGLMIAEKLRQAGIF